MSSEPISSQWWRGVVVYALLAVLLLVSFAIPIAKSTILGALYFVVLLGMIVMVVVFPLTLYKDTAAIRRSTVAWNPNPYFYGVLGFTQLFAFADGRVELYALPLAVALAYLYQRYRHVRTW